MRAIAIFLGAFLIANALDRIASALRSISINL